MLRSRFSSAKGRLPATRVEQQDVSSRQPSSFPSIRKFPGNSLTMPPPDYTTLDSQPLNRAVTALFRRKMVAAVGEDVDAEG